jgi:hypothetical protein
MHVLFQQDPSVSETPCRAARLRRHVARTGLHQGCALFKKESGLDSAVHRGAAQRTAPVEHANARRYAAASGAACMAGLALVLREDLGMGTTATGTGPSRPLRSGSGCASW